MDKYGDWVLSKVGFVNRKIKKNKNNDNDNYRAATVDFFEDKTVHASYIPNVPLPHSISKNPGKTVVLLV